MLLLLPNFASKYQLRNMFIQYWLVFPSSKLNIRIKKDQPNKTFNKSGENTLE